MSQKRKNFIVKNDGFVCEKCGEKNPPAKGTCRNHCRKCFFSKHVDEEVPGDRKSLCEGLMEPISADYSGAKGFQIIHQCVVCHKKMKNMLADDDDRETFTIVIASEAKQSL